MTNKTHASRTQHLVRAGRALGLPACAAALLLLACTPSAAAQDGVVAGELAAGPQKSSAAQLECEPAAELERSAQTDSKARASVQTAKRSPTRTGKVETNRTSSVEYIIAEIKRHKRRAVSISGLIVLAVAWYLGWRFRPATEEAPMPPKNAAFTQLTDQAGEEYFSSLSPDGKSFVYASHASGNSDVYLQRVGGRNPINLTKDSLSDDTQPAFSPDGEHIAFRSEREGGGIFVMGATGESVKRLTDFGFNPAWSPDSKEIACAEKTLSIPPPA